MNGFLWVAADTAGVSVTYPDTIPRPRRAQPQHFLVQPLTGAQPIDFKMGWLPQIPTRLAAKRPVHPNWIGTDFSAINIPAPTGWLPTYPTFRDAPRLHRTFYRSAFDPQSGESTRIAASMAWDPKQKAPLIVRPKIARTQFAYTTEARIAVGGNLCVHLVDTDYAVPSLMTQAVARPAFIDEAFTRPSLSDQEYC